MMHLCLGFLLAWRGGAGEAGVRSCVDASRRVGPSPSRLTGARVQRTDEPIEVVMARAAGRTAIGTGALWVEKQLLGFLTRREAAPEPGSAGREVTPVREASGAYRDRTGDLRLAKPALSQLS
jgi:hypothetical protein